MTGARSNSVAKAAANSARGGSGAIAPGSVQRNLSNLSKGRSPRAKAPANNRKMQAVPVAGRGNPNDGQKNAQLKAQSLQMQQQAMLTPQMQQQQRMMQQQAAHNNRPASARQMSVGGNTIPAHIAAQQGQPLKRSRSSSITSKETELKRSKVGVGGTARGQQSQGNTHRSVPQSPTSSRSRASKQKQAAQFQNAQESSNASKPTQPHTGAASASFNPGSRQQRVQNGKARQAQARQQQQTRYTNHSITFVVDGTPVPSDVKVPSQAGRIFGHEIQCMMHAFGEARACTRDSLELVEDAVRDTVRRIAFDALALAEEAGAESSTGDLISVCVDAHHVAFLIRHDSRATYRLNQALKTVMDHGPEDEANQIRHYMQGAVFTAEPSYWELISELASLPNDDAQEPERHDSLAINDLSRVCTWRAYLLFRAHHPHMHTPFTDYAKCRSTNFVTNDSRNPAANLKGQRRLLLLRKWLGMDHVSITIPALYALGHIAWEAVGLLTQRALVEKYFDDLKSDLGDARSMGWSRARHTLAALSHGIATAIMVPLSEPQLLSLRQEVEQLPSLMRAATDTWRGAGKGCRCLQPQHIREALRRSQSGSNNYVLNVMLGRSYFW